MGGDAVGSDALDHWQNVGGKGGRFGSVHASALSGGLGKAGHVAQLDTPELQAGQGGACASRDQLTLLLGQGRVDVEHEGVSILAQLGDEKRDAL